MLTTDKGFFIQIPDASNQRILHPACIAGVSDGTYTAQLEENDLSIEAGDDVFVYFEVRNEFMQQPARVSTVFASEPALTIGFELQGDPVSAESRQCYRVSTAVSDLPAQLGDDEHGRLLDVSATGFSIESSEEFEVGQKVQATLHYEGKSFSGAASVQSRKELDGGRIRYGLHCTESHAKGKDSNLLKGMQQISMSVQREHLRRRSGAA